MSSKHEQQLKRAWDAFGLLTSSLEDLVGALQSNVEGVPSKHDIDAEGQNVALAVDAMTSALCKLDALELPADMKTEESSLDELLAYLLTAGHIQDEQAPEMAAGIIEYAAAAAYGEYPRNLENFPGIQNYEHVTDAIDELLNRLEQAP